MAYFPIYIELENKPCLVVGGGEIALHKVKVLLDFGAKVKVVSKEVCQAIKDLNIQWLEKEIDDNDFTGIELVVVATNDNEVNHEIASIARTKKIMVNTVDQIEDCDFIFSSYLKEGKLVASFSSGGSSPLIAKFMKDQNKEVVTKELAQMAEIMNKYRPIVKSKLHDEKARHLVFEEMFEQYVSTKQIPSEIELDKIIDKYIKREG